MRAQDKKLQELLKEVEALTTPTSAFITFESDDTKSYALRQDGTGATKLLGQPFKFNDASEPTDIIWENRQYTKIQRTWRQILAFAIIGLLLFVSFLIILAISNYSARIAAVFPPVDCGNIKKSYVTDDMFQTYAVKDFDYITENKG